MTEHRDRRHFHAFHYTEPQAGIFVFVAVVVKETKTEKVFFGGEGREGDKFRKAV